MNKRQNVNYKRQIIIELNLWLHQRIECHVDFTWLWIALQTWTTPAPAWINWMAASAESHPPVAMIGNPGKSFAIDETAFKAMGRIAFPDTPPYVVLCNHRSVKIKIRVSQNPKLKHTRNWWRSESFNDSYFFNTNSRPRGSSLVSSKSHQSWHSIDCSNTCQATAAVPNAKPNKVNKQEEIKHFDWDAWIIQSDEDDSKTTGCSTLLSCNCNFSNLSDIRCQFRKERNLHCLTNPFTDISYKFRVLTTCQSHTSKTQTKQQSNLTVPSKDTKKHFHFLVSLWLGQVIMRVYLVHPFREDKKDWVQEHQHQPLLSSLPVQSNLFEIVTTKRFSE